MAEKSRHTATSSDAKRSKLENLLKEAKSCSSKIESLEAQASDLEQLRREHLHNWLNELVKASTPKLSVYQNHWGDAYLFVDLNLPDFLTVSTEEMLTDILSHYYKELCVEGVGLKFYYKHSPYNSLQCKGFVVETSLFTKLNNSLTVKFEDFDVPLVERNFSRRQLCKSVLDFLEEQNATILYPDDSSVTFNLSKKLEKYTPKAVIKRLLELKELHPERSHFEVSSTETTYILDVFEETSRVSAEISTQDGTGTFYLNLRCIPCKKYHLIRKSKLGKCSFKSVDFEELDYSKLPTIEDLKQALRDKMESSEKS